MGLDINTKKLKKNAFRVTKERGIGASRIRVPGGYLNAEVLGMIQDIAQTYGNGYVHLTTRQGFEIEGIRLEDMEEINKKLQPIIEILGINQEVPGTGYPASSCWKRAGRCTFFRTGSFPAAPSSRRAPRTAPAAPCPPWEGSAYGHPA